MKSQEAYHLINTNNKIWQGPVDVPTWLDKIIFGVPEGTRHDSAIRLVGRWYSRGLRRKEVALLLFLWNTMNDPPLSRDEIISICDSTMKWERPCKDYQMSDEEAQEYVREIKRQIKAKKL